MRLRGEKGYEVGLGGLRNVCGMPMGDRLRCSERAGSLRVDLALGEFAESVELSDFCFLRATNGNKALESSQGRERWQERAQT